jgi:hypothetical protein
LWQYIEGEGETGSSEEEDNGEPEIRDERRRVVVRKKIMESPRSEMRGEST